jgi:hypothetical protein
VKWVMPAQEAVAALAWKEEEAVARCAHAVVTSRSLVTTYAALCPRRHIQRAVEGRPDLAVEDGVRNPERRGRQRQRGACREEETVRGDGPNREVEQEEAAPDQEASPEDIPRRRTCRT